MSIQTDLEIFERAVESHGRLLRVESDRIAGPPRMLLLTFDVGRILVIPTREGLSALEVKERGEAPTQLFALDEDEPWWRLLGHPLTAAWPGDAGDASGARSLREAAVLKLRFREEDANPWVVAIAAAGDSLQVSLEK